MTQISLDSRKSHQQHLRELPGSLPSTNGMPGGPWSGVPLWRGLDSDFLCAPSFPKPPAAPRVKIEMVGRSLRISDESEQGLLALGEQSRGAEILRRALKPQHKVLLFYAFLGFVGGVVAAWLLGVIR